MGGPSHGAVHRRPPPGLGHVVFFTTTTEFPLDPCRCHETALYTLTTDGDEAYTTGGGAPTGGNTTVEEVATWEGRATAPFIADQHVYVGVDDDLRVLGDPDDFNNGASTESVRITSWREIR